jgi:hypothetical protein
MTASYFANVMGLTFYGADRSSGTINSPPVLAYSFAMSLSSIESVSVYLLIQLYLITIQYQIILINNQSCNMILNYHFLRFVDVKMLFLIVVSSAIRLKDVSYSSA